MFSNQKISDPIWGNRASGKTNEVVDVKGNKSLGKDTPFGTARSSNEVAETRAKMGTDDSRGLGRAYSGAGQEKKNEPPPESEYDKLKKSLTESITKDIIVNLAKTFPTIEETRSIFNNMTPPVLRHIGNAMPTGRYAMLGPSGSMMFADLEAGGGGGLDLSKCALGYKIDPNGNDPNEIRIYAGEIDRIAVAQADVTVANNGYVYVRRTISNNTMLVATAASVPENDATYVYYRLYRFTVTAGAASILGICRPFDIETSSGGSGGFTGTVTVITSIAFNTSSLQYKTKLLTYANGLLTSVGAESGWTTIFTAVTGCP